MALLRDRVSGLVPDVSEFWIVIAERKWDMPR